MSTGGSARPAVLLYHGLHSDKETHRAELVDLAARGFLALAPDAVGHGGRRMPDLSSFLRRGPLLHQVEKLLRPTLAEVPLLVDFLLSEGYGPIGVCGISFGGLLTYGVPLAEPRVSALVSILGDPGWCQPGPDREAEWEAYRRPALLAWNGGRDEHVPPGPAREFMTELRRRFSDERHRFLEYPESNHFMRADDWRDGWSRTLDFLGEHLPL